MPSEIITLNGEQVNAIDTSAQCRRLIIGTNWNRVRIGGRIAFEDSGIDITGNPVLFLGVCSGDLAPYGRPLPTHSVGAKLGWGGGGQWFALNFTRATYRANGFWATKKVGAIETISPQTVSAIEFTRDNTGLPRIPFGVEITKGSPNFIVRVLAASIPKTVDISFETYRAGMQLEDINQCATLWNVSALTSQVVPVNEGVDGGLNAVDIFWSKNLPRLLLSEIYVAKFN